MKKDQGGKKFHLVHEKKVQGGKKTSKQLSDPVLLINTTEQFENEKLVIFSGDLHTFSKIYEKDFNFYFSFDAQSEIQIWNGL